MDVLPFSTIALQRHRWEWKWKKSPVKQWKIFVSSSRTTFGQLFRRRISIPAVAFWIVISFGFLRVVSVIRSSPGLSNTPRISSRFFLYKRNPWNRGYFDWISHIFVIIIFSSFTTMFLIALSNKKWFTQTTYLRKKLGRPVRRMNHRICFILPAISHPNIIKIF